MSLEQVEMEYQSEIAQLQQIQQDPQAMQNPSIQQGVMDITMKIESRKAVLIAEMMEDYNKEEKKILGDFANDPIAKLRDRELDLRAQENMRKEREGEERLNLDKMRAMMNQENQEDKLKQNEELSKMISAELRQNEVFAGLCRDRWQTLITFSIALKAHLLIRLF